MRFLVDECTGPRVAKWLQEQGHDVFSVYDQSRGLADEALLDKANHEKRILITNDKDFGEKVYREKRPHSGVIFLRLADERSSSKIRAVERLFKQHTDDLSNLFVVVTESQIRFGQ